MQLFTNVIHWCNQNAGFLSALLTLAYLVATVALVWLARRQLQLALNLEKDRLRPVVLFDLVQELPWIFLSIKNFGQTTARDVKIDVNPQIRSVYGNYGNKTFERSEPIPVIQNGIPMLPPGKEIRGLVGHYSHVCSYTPEKRFIGTVSYSDTDGSTRYSESVIIDLSTEEGLRQIRRNTIHDVAQTLEKLRDDIHNIATGYSQSLARIINESDFQQRQEEKIE